MNVGWDVKTYISNSPYQKLYKSQDMLSLYTALAFKNALDIIN